MIKVRPASAGPSYATSPRPAPHYGSGTRGRRDRCLMRDRGGVSRYRGIHAPWGYRGKYHAPAIRPCSCLPLGWTPESGNRIQGHLNLGACAVVSSALHTHIHSVLIVKREREN